MIRFVVLFGGTFSRVVIGVNDENLHRLKVGVARAA
jgi:hypothetical protein